MTPTVTAISTAASAASPTSSPIAEANAPFTVTRRIALSGSVPAEQLISAGQWLFASTCNPHCALVRVDPQTDQVTPTPITNGVRDLVFADGELWVTIGAVPGDQQGTVKPALVVLDPATLDVKRAISLTEVASGLAFAGGQIWIADKYGFTAVDPHSGTITHQVAGTLSQPDHDHFLISASDDGSLLWTTNFSMAGGAFPVELRDGTDGHVIAATVGPGAIGPTGIAAAGDHVWFSFATGMMGSFVGFRLTEGHLVQVPLDSNRQPLLFANGISTHLAHGQLWLVDQMSGSVACARDSNGQVLARTRLDGLVSNAFAAMPNGQVAISAAGQVLIVQPNPACGP